MKYVHLEVIWFLVNKDNIAVDTSYNNSSATDVSGYLQTILQHLETNYYHQNPSHQIDPSPTSPPHLTIYYTYKPNPSNCM